MWLISILAYHLRHAIEQVCRARGDNRSWPTLNGELDTRRALTVELGDASGRRHHLRLATKPIEEQKRIYRMLGLREQPLRTRRYVVEPAGSDETEMQFFLRKALRSRVLKLG